jgi:hypothetical protein
VRREVLVITIACCACGIVFGAPEVFDSGRRRDGKTFYCPNGDPLSYKPTTVEKLRDDLATARRELDQARAELAKPPSRRRRKANS